MSKFAVTLAAASISGAAAAGGSMTASGVCGSFDAAYVEAGCSKDTPNKKIADAHLQLRPGKRTGGLVNVAENPCAGKKPVDPLYDNKNCSDVATDGYNGPQSGTNVTKGYAGDFVIDGKYNLTTGEYAKRGLCAVNVHWHLGAEHLSVGEFDVDPSTPNSGPATKAYTGDVYTAEHNALRTNTTNVRVGYRCNRRSTLTSAQLEPYNFKFCSQMEVGETYEIHWPHSAFGACNTPWQMQYSFYDGVVCGIPNATDTVADLKLNDPATLLKSVGVQGQVFLIVNDPAYYFPNMLFGRLKNSEMWSDVAIYAGSTTGTSRDNTQCSMYSPITWQVDRKCHLLDARAMDKLCADMLLQPDDMTLDTVPHGSRELVSSQYSADNHADHEQRQLAGAFPASDMCAVDTTTLAPTTVASHSDGNATTTVAATTVAASDSNATTTVAAATTTVAQSEETEAPATTVASSSGNETTVASSETEAPTTVASSSGNETTNPPLEVEPAQVTVLVETTMTPPISPPAEETGSEASSGNATRRLAGHGSTPQEIAYDMFCEAFNEANAYTMCDGLVQAGQIHYASELFTTLDKCLMSSSYVPTGHCFATGTTGLCQRNSPAERNTHQQCTVHEAVTGQAGQYKYKTEATMTVSAAAQTASAGALTAARTAATTVQTAATSAEAQTRLTTMFVVKAAEMNANPAVKAAVNLTAAFGLDEATLAAVYTASQAASFDLASPPTSVSDATATAIAATPSLNDLTVTVTLPATTGVTITTSSSVGRFSKIGSFLFALTLSGFDARLSALAFLAFNLQPVSAAGSYSYEGSKCSDMKNVFKDDAGCCGDSASASTATGFQVIPSVKVTANSSTYGSNPCANTQPTLENIALATGSRTYSGNGTALDNGACADMLEAQSGVNVSVGYAGALNTTAGTGANGALPIGAAGNTDPAKFRYWQRTNGMCPVNVHWHLGTEHLSVGEYDVPAGTAGSGPATIAFTKNGSATSATYPHSGGADFTTAISHERLGYRCNEYSTLTDAQKLPYDWQHCTQMEVGETYEVHWPTSALGDCRGLWQYQTPFYDGVLCGVQDAIAAENALQTAGAADQNLANIVGVQGQVFLIVNDESYYYPNLLQGMIVDGEFGTEMTYYIGSTTGTSRSNLVCSAYSPITWQVDRKCHKISASSFDKLCADMMQQADDMSGDLYPHGSRELVSDAFATTDILFKTAADFVGSEIGHELVADSKNPGATR